MIELVNQFKIRGMNSMTVNLIEFPIYPTAVNILIQKSQVYINTFSYNII